MVQAWKLAEGCEVPTSPHKKTPNELVDVHSLEKCGIFFKKLDPTVQGYDYKEDPVLKEYCAEKEYGFSDILTISKDCLKNYDETLKRFNREHCHPDDESRYILEGTGYFDIRYENDEWVRMKIEVGDLFTQPSGMYHRFVLDDNSPCLKMVRLFVSNPIWTPIYRSDDPSNEHFVRKEYLKKYEF